MTTLLIIVGAAVLYGVLHSTMDWLKDRAVDEERARRAEAEAELARKQAEVIASKRTVEDAARDLDRGEF